MQDYWGTARFTGLGGAMGALGGDFGAIITNPAGLATYRKSEIMITPSIFTASTQSSFWDNPQTDLKYNFNISNLGMVITNTYSKRVNGEEVPGWKSVSYAFGINRLANYNRDVYYNGFNPDNSMIDKFLEIANSGSGVAPSEITDRYPFDAGLAYQTYLIDPILTDTMHYASKVPYGGVEQSRKISTRGGFDEYLFSIAGNYDNKIQIGVTIGMPRIRYTEESSYHEEDVNDTIAGFKSFTKTDYLKTTGSGVNFRLGLIYRITPYIRVGGALHSPSFLSLRDDYSSTMSSDLESTGNYQWDSPDGTFKYNLTTPWRAVISGAVLFKTRGLISVDYEWLDYSNTFFGFATSEQAFESQLNQTIRDKYGPSGSLRLGGEYRFGVFIIRGGINYSGSPFQPGVAVQDADLSRAAFSLGGGLHDKNYFMDLTYVSASSTSMDVPYTLSDPNETVGGAVLTNASSNILFTFGLRF